MATWLKQSTAVDIAIGPFLDETDGKTAETALTITQPDIRLKKNGGAWAQKNAAQTLTHEEAGWYEVALDATDTNTLGVLVVAIHETGALPVWREFLVVAANVYDSLIGGGDVLDVSTTQFNGSAVTQSGGRPEVNTTHAAGTAWGSGAITAGAIAADAITAAKIADAAIDAATFAAGAINAAAIAADAITAAKIADGAIDAATFAAGAINAAAIAADAITDAKVASDVTIASVTGAVGSVTAAVTVGTNNDKTGYAIGTGGIAAAAFAAGAIDAAAIAADAIGSSELAASAVDEILDDTIGDGTITVRQALRVMVAALAGKLSGAATTTVTIRNTADSADVIVATVDADGNRSAVTVTP